MALPRIARQQITWVNAGNRSSASTTPRVNWTQVRGRSFSPKSVRGMMISAAGWNRCLCTRSRLEVACVEARRARHRLCGRKRGCNKLCGAAHRRRAAQATDALHIRPHLFVCHLARRPTGHRPRHPVKQRGADQEFPVKSWLLGAQRDCVPAGTDAGVFAGIPSIDTFVL
jgi:hypothetical protein